jgi:hypothetical protein
MAVVTNTFRSTSAVGNREQLSDVVSRIDPEDTPIYSMLSKESTSGTKPEWEWEALNSPGVNANEEGDDYTFDASTTPTRVGNYTQIFRKTGRISETQEAVDDAGQVQKIKHQKLLRGIELRKDLEYAIVANTASVGGTTRYLGSLPSWLTTNVSRNSGSNGGYNAGTGLTVAESTGTQRAFTKTLLDTVAQTGYNNGANFKQVVVSPYVKSVFVTFMSDTNVASFRYVTDSGTNNSIIATADVYEGPFGKLMVTPNRVMAGAAGLARRASFIDPEMMSFVWLRKIHSDPDVARTGDAKSFVLIGEGTLKVKNEKGLGVVADLYGLTASS